MEASSVRHKLTEHHHFLLGTGLRIESEYQIADHVAIRPVKLTDDINELAQRANSQFEYGVLCSFSSAVTFELDVTAASQRAAAIAAWNTQWICVLLSIIGGSPVYSPFQAWASSYSQTPPKIAISNIVGAHRFYSEPREFPASELETCRELLPKFHILMENPRFAHAAAIAASNFIEPRESVRMAGIWSGIEALLGLDNELRFRISLIVARLLEATSEARLKRFESVKKLYDVRSKCVHGTLSSAKIEKAGVTDSLELLRRLILLFVQRGTVLDKREATDLLLS